MKLLGMVGTTGSCSDSPSRRWALNDVRATLPAQRAETIEPREGGEICPKPQAGRHNTTSIALPLRPSSQSVNPTRNAHRIRCHIDSTEYAIRPPCPLGPLGPQVHRFDRPSSLVPSSMPWQVVTSGFSHACKTRPDEHANHRTMARQTRPRSHKTTISLHRRDAESLASFDGQRI